MSHVHENTETEYQAGRLDIEEEMLGLYYNIDSLLSHIQGKLIQFIGSQKGEGTTTLIREFARVSSLKLGKRVLLMKADSQETKSDVESPMTLEYDLKSLIDHFPDAEISDSKEVEEQYTTQVLVEIHAPALSPAFSSAHVKRFCENLKRQFDLILIDSPPVSASPDGLAVARHMDGVVLVVEAENTRWRMVDHVKNRISQANGKILGIIFNKQRHYIPAFIYRFL